MKLLKAVKIFQLHKLQYMILQTNHGLAKKTGLSPINMSVKIDDTSQLEEKPWFAQNRNKIAQHFKNIKTTSIYPVALTLDLAKYFFTLCSYSNNNKQYTV